MLATNEEVIMQTAITQVQNPETQEILTVRVLLDSGIQRTYMTENLKKDLKLNSNVVDNTSVHTFGNKKPKKIKAPRVQIDLIPEQEEKLRLTCSSNYRTNSESTPAVTSKFTFKRLYFG